MKLSTFNNRVKNINKGSKGYQFALDLLQGNTSSWDDNKVRTCHTSGSGRFCKNLDYTEDTLYTLKLAGLKQGIDFEFGNDSKRGGLTGNFVKLTSKGKSKMIK